MNYVEEKCQIFRFEFLFRGSQNILFFYHGLYVLSFLGKKLDYVEEKLVIP